MLKTHQDKVSASATLLTKGPDKVNHFSAQKKPEMEPGHEKKNRYKYNSVLLSMLKSDCQHCSLSLP